MTMLIASSLRARAHRKADFIFGGICFRQNHERQIAFAEWRQRKFNPHMSLVIARTRVARIYGCALNSRLDLSPRLGLPIDSPQNLHIKFDVACRQPRLRIEKLDLN